ncbi:lysophospholipid acyltransferase family protein [Desmospora profundinema]|uniref:lysophospholipid acyltransferase family protein n=1 Tax=Desmospora profundinema TaxID=1571184 RepID=UPI00286CE439|nr:lysophospholipid acyltransferase family protein [Desmospora profundinema]
MYFMLRWILRMFLKGYHRIEVVGADQLPHDGPFILVGNHISNLDPFYIGAAMPGRIHFMAKRESFSHPLSRWVLHACGAFPVERGKPDMRAIKTAIHHLRHDRIVGLFPEGGRREEDPMVAIKAGAAYLSLKTQTPVLPITIEGTDRALPRSAWLIRPIPIRIRVGEQMVPEKDMSREAQERLSRHVLESLRLLSTDENR